MTVALDPLHPASATTAATAAAPAAGTRPLALFANPIVAARSPAGSADPSVVFHDGRFAYCRSLGDRAIGIAFAPRLQDIGTAPMDVVWQAEPGTPWSAEIWAPDLQHIGDRWYIYFAASDGDNRQHRMYALESQGDDPRGPYTFRGRITAPTDRWAIDGLTVMVDGRLHFVWSGWRDDDAGFPQVLYIAPMSDPLTISGERVEIAAPDQPWEQRGAPLLEGPAPLYRDGRLFVAYSASASWTEDYAIGLLAFDGGDPLSPAAWRKLPGPAFAPCPEVRIYGPGHNSFVKSPDGREDWIVYHAIDRPGAGWAGRSVRAQRFGWHADGTPHLGQPVGPGVPIEEPSGSPAPGL
jgi:GH43 family beta-xylosidase